MGQNTLVFNLDTALRMMGDVAEFYVANEIRNHYFVSISGYHIAEAGANPLTQAALTLSMHWSRPSFAMRSAAVRPFK